MWKFIAPLFDITGRKKQKQQIFIASWYKYVGTPQYVIALRKWVALFEQGKNSLEDAERPGRPASTVNQETIGAIESLIAQDPHVTIREISEILLSVMGQCSR